MRIRTSLGKSWTFRILIVTVAFFLTTPVVQATLTPFFVTWGASLNYASGAGVTVNSLGDVFVAGTTGPVGAFVYFSVLILKYNPSGVLQWQKTWGMPPSPRSDVGNSITIDSSGSLYVTGEVSENGVYAAFLIKLSSAGDLLWQSVLGNETYGKEIIVSPSGENYWVVTPSYIRDDGLVLIRFDAQGKPAWEITWKGGLAEGATIDQAGNIYVTGTSPYYDINQPNGTYDPLFHYSDGLLLKFNSTGNLVWQRIWRFSSSYQESENGVVTDSFGNVYVAGASLYGKPGCLSCPELNVASITKFDSNGTILWHRANAGASPGGFNAFTGLVPKAIATAATNQVFIVGNNYNTNGVSNPFLMELDSNGNMISSVSWDNAFANGIAVDSSGSPIVVGGMSALPRSLNFSKQTFNDSLPTVAIPEGFIQNSTILIQNATGQISNAFGSTKFVGTSDVFLSSNYSFPVSTLPAQQLLMLGVTLPIAASVLASMFRKRSIVTKMVG